MTTFPVIRAAAVNAICHVHVQCLSLLVCANEGGASIEFKVSVKGGKVTAGAPPVGSLRAVTSAV